MTRTTGKSICPLAHGPLVPDPAKARTIGIDPEVYTAFQQAVLTKHGKLRGVLADEATAAIRAHIERLQEE